MSDDNQPDSIDVFVGLKVRGLRLARGWSQQELAAACQTNGKGISFQQVQKYERGSNRISCSRLWQIAKALKVPVAFFFEDIPEEFEKGDIPSSLGEWLGSHVGQEWHRVAAPRACLAVAAARRQGDGQ